MRAPVVLFLFNRPDLTARVFAQIAAARPERLYLIADGPRPGHRDDPALCAAARAAVAGIDWPCRIHRELSPVNLGTAGRLTSGLDLVFAAEEEAVVLEDDCLPSPSFFPFCDALLERFRDEPRVGSVIGTNPVADLHAMPADYGFSRHPLLWGWASWRRTWARYDRSLEGLTPALRDGSLERHLGGDLSFLFWQEMFLRTRARQAETWDHQLNFAHLRHGLLAAVPARNLVSNLGVGRRDATHTHELTAMAALPLGTLAFPLRHPEPVVADVGLERLIERHAFGVPDAAPALLAWIRRARARSVVGTPAALP